MNEDSCFVTLIGLFGVLVQLSELPVQVGVPGLQLKVVERFDMEVRPLDLQVTVEHVLIWIVVKQRIHLICFSALRSPRHSNLFFKEQMMEEKKKKQKPILLKI